MTTTERPPGYDASALPSQAGPSAPPQLGLDAPGAFAQLDAAAIERIAANLASALPGPAAVAPVSPQSASLPAAAGIPPASAIPTGAVPQLPSGVAAPTAPVESFAPPRPRFFEQGATASAAPTGAAPDYYFLTPISVRALPALPEASHSATLPDPRALPGGAVPPAATIPGTASGVSLPGAPLPGTASPPGVVVPDGALIGAPLPGGPVPAGGLPPGVVVPEQAVINPALPQAALPIPGTPAPSLAQATAPAPGLVRLEGAAPSAPVGLSDVSPLQQAPTERRPPRAHITDQQVSPSTVPGSVFPQATSAAASAPAALPAGALGGVLPTTGAPFPGPDSVDLALPRLFDESDAPPAHPPRPSSQFYFLAPPSAPRSATHAPFFSRRSFDVDGIRRDFPILQEKIHGKPLVWLDNAATTHKPNLVIDRLVHYYRHEYSNVHRAAHTLAARSTDAYEAAREKVQRFLGAGSPKEIVFVRGTTEAVNLVANSWGRRNIGMGDEIILTTIEHHSNIVPWQLVAKDVGAVLRIVPVSDRGEVLLSEYGKLLNDRTKMVAITHVSNALGTIVPVAEMAQAAHRHGARVLIDGAQAVSHFPVNVQALDADFYVFSAHKMFGPTGAGALYGKKALLDEMPPWQGGGNMIQDVTFEESTFADPPARFEAGTATLGPAVGLGAAVDYLERIGMENVARHEQELLAYATDVLSRIRGLRFIGTAPDKAGVISFVPDGIGVEEMGRYLDTEGIAVRAGHHCAQPTMRRFGVEGTVRPSLALYNTHHEIDVLARAVRKALRH